MYGILRYSSTNSLSGRYMEVSVQIHSPASKSPGKKTRYPKCTRDLEGPKFSLDVFENGKISYRCRDTNSRQSRE